MLKSMTAYARKALTIAQGNFTIEIQSVNRRHFEANIFLPREFSHYEGDVRKLLQSEILRGQITLKIFAQIDNKTLMKITPNIPFVLELKKNWDHVMSTLNIKESNDAFLHFLTKQNDIFTFSDSFEEDDKYKSIFLDLTKEVLKDFIEMREKEGLLLQEDILQRLKALEGYINEIERLTPNATAKYRQKLIERIEEVIGKNIENEERILREVALFSEKIDITEEVTRFKAHLITFEDLLSSDKPSPGKTLEFILQELLRETNTIGSKSSDIAIAHLVVSVKSELEKIREQIQNVE